MSINETNKKLEQESQTIIDSLIEETEAIKQFMNYKLEEKASLVQERLDLQLKILNIDSRIKDRALSNYFIRTIRKGSMFILFTYAIIGIIVSVGTGQFIIWPLLLTTLLSAIITINNERSIKNQKENVKHLNELNLEEKLDSLYEELDTTKDLITVNDKHYNELKTYYDVLIKKIDSITDVPLTTMYFERKEFKIEKPKVKTLRK